MNNEFNTNHLLFLLHGAAWTLGLSATGFVGGGLLGFLVALGRIAPSRLCRGLVGIYVQLIQGTPLLILMFLAYFGLGIMGFDVPPLAAAGLAMTIYTSAYLGRSGAVRCSPCPGRSGKPPSACPSVPRSACS